MNLSLPFRLPAISAPICLTQARATLEETREREQSALKTIQEIRQKASHDLAGLHEVGIRAARELPAHRRVTDALSF